MLDERSKKILWAIIDSYILSNGPVGSRTVTRRYSFGLSPATIRNTMADLEEMGYITQPYTSAGRIPTDKGYRLYVDSILKRHAISTHKELLQSLLKELHIIEKDINSLIKEASRTLSDYSHYLGLASPPKTEDITLKRIEFLPHSRKSVFSVLISEEGIVKNKIVGLSESFTQKKLKKMTEYLNRELSGLTLKDIKRKIADEIAEKKLECDKLIMDALYLCKSVLAWERENIFSVGEVSGTCNLPDFATMEQIKELFTAIEDKHLMIKLLDRISEAEGVQVFIGSENILSEIRELSMVASTYHDNHRVLGTIGIIGPMRMNYEKVIPIVDLMAKTITRILSER